MKNNLHFECLSGISGDMTLAALIDLGADRDRVRAGLASLGLEGLELKIEEVKKCGFAATYIRVEHPEQKAHRHLHHIEAMIEAATDITPSAKDLARRIFQCIGEAEAKVHGCSLQKVHFHEVGAVDSIADIVGVAIAFDSLGIDQVTSSSIPTGTGSIVIDHGRVAVPAPATAEILTGVPVAAGDIEAELTTPTGAAIIKTLASSFGPAPAMIPRRVGYGAGTKDLPNQANVLRITMGELIEQHAHSTDRCVETDQVSLLETNIDDATAEQLACVADRLLHCGALDVWQTPIVMKKGRLASTLSVLCGKSKVSVMEDILFHHTTTIGIRKQSMQRTKLKRQTVEIQTEHGPAKGKVSTLPDGSERFSLEADEATRLSGVTRKPVAVVSSEIEQAWRQTKSS